MDDSSQFPKRENQDTFKESNMSTPLGYIREVNGVEFVKCRPEKGPETYDNIGRRKRIGYILQINGFEYMKTSRTNYTSTGQAHVDIGTTLTIGGLTVVKNNEHYYESLNPIGSLRISDGMEYVKMSSEPGPGTYMRNGPPKEVGFIMTIGGVEFERTHNQGYVPRDHNPNYLEPISSEAEQKSIDLRKEHCLNTEADYQDFIAERPQFCRQAAQKRPLRRHKRLGKNEEFWV